jgi:branched-chain amino acid transport system permease protein
VKRMPPALWVALAALSLFFIFPDYLALGTTVLVMVLLSLSLDLVLGEAGIITLGQSAFFGTGAYVAALWSQHSSAEPVSGLMVSTAVSGALGLVSGALILHTEGITLLMLTLALGALLTEIANQLSWTGGADGLAVHTGPLLHLFAFDLQRRVAYLYALSVLLLWFGVFCKFKTSPLGRSVDGIRQNAVRMRALGTPVWRRRVVVYTLGAAMAGSAGAVSAQTTRFVGLTTLSVATAGTAVVMLVLGGSRRRYGAFVGAPLYLIAQDLFAQMNPFYWMFFVGVLLVASVLLLEDGLLSLGARLRRLRAPRLSVEDAVSRDAVSRDAVSRDAAS